MFTMAIAFSAALAALFFFTLLSPEVARFISSLTGDGTNARESGSLSDSLKGAQNQQNLPGQELETALLPSSAEPLPPVAQRHTPCGGLWLLSLEESSSGRSKRLENEQPNVDKSLAYTWNAF